MPQNFRDRGLDTLPPLPEITLPAARTLYPRYKDVEIHSIKKERYKPPPQKESIETYLRDAQDALEGIPSDLISGGSSVFTKGNRLRGLGLILVLVGAVLFLLEITR